MPRFEVYYISKLSKHVGNFEAANEAEAFEMAEQGDAYQGIGGPCHQCSDGLGDPDDGEFVAFEMEPGQ